MPILNYSKMSITAAMTLYGIPSSINGRKNPEYNKLYDLDHREKYRKYHREYLRKWNALHKKKLSDWHREWNRELKHETLLHYGPNPPRCACCGETDERFLGLSHVNNDGAAHRRSYGPMAKGNKFYRLLKADGWPNEYPLKVECYNCNQGANGNRGICPHKDPPKIEVVLR
jgi:hypothetical protein